MPNTIETVWRIVLDEKEAREGENAIQRLARVLKDELGAKGSKAVDKTTEAIKEQTKALQENEDAARKAGDASSSLGDAGGKIGGAAGKLRGVGDLFGGGEGLGIVNDIGDAIEGMQELGSTIGALGPAALVAGPALLILGAVIADFAKGAQEQADKINEIIEAQRSAFDEIASGATSDDIEEEIAALQFRRELEKQTLAESTQAYTDFVEGIRQAFGVFAPLIEGVLKVIDPREDTLKAQIEKSNKLISESEAKERAYNSALEQGLTSKADAKKAESERQKAQADAARDSAAAAKEQQREREKTAAESTRSAEQQAAKEQQVNEKRYQAAQKYTDALLDIANKSADDARKALADLRMTLADNRESFLQDMSDISADFQASEYEESIKRHEQELQDAVNQTRKLEQIRDDAFKSEQDALRQRDFLGASKIREAANEQIEAENKLFVEAQIDKLNAQKSEDAAQLRQLDKARRERLQALDRANADAKQAYQRDIIAQREARKIAEREAAMARNRELRSASDTARALLGIASQQQQAQIMLAQNTLGQLRGMNNVTNNNNKTVNGGINFNMGSGAGGVSATQIQSTVLQILGSVGLA